MGTSYDERIINSQEGFEASMKHFQKFSKTLRGCTDVDLMYERNGKFLFLEGKQVSNHWTTLTMPWAQWFALKQLRNLDTKKVKVFIVAYTADGKYTFFPMKPRCWLSSRPWQTRWNAVNLPVRGKLY